MTDLTLTAIGAVMAALRNDPEAVALLLDTLDTDQLRTVTHTSLLALAAGVRHTDGGTHIVTAAVDQLRQQAYSLTAEGDPT